MIDGKEITYEERERVELIFATDYRPSPQFVQDSRLTTTKVPLKLTSMNFEMMSGLAMPGGMGMGISQQPQMQLAAGSQVPTLSLSAPLQPTCTTGTVGSNAVGGSKDGEWHPYTNSTDDFFLN